MRYAHIKYRTYDFLLPYNSFKNERNLKNVIFFIPETQLSLS